MPANTIEKVISRLEQIVREAIETNDNLGIFAQMYLGVTRQVRDGILAGQFEDGPRMERLDVIFANRYLDALDAYKAGGKVTSSWKTAFDAARKNDFLVLQHLFMGMNAHINLDLGIAASVTVPPSQLADLKPDFDEINTILTNNIEALQRKINEASPLLFLLDWFGQKSDEHLMGFSIRKARSHAWVVAQRLSKKASDSERQLLISELDKYVSILNKFITEPGIFGGAVVRFVKWFEVKDAAKVIKLIG